MTENNTSPPRWFEQSIWHLFDLYPGVMPSKTTTISWWREMRHNSEQAIKNGIRRAIQDSPARMPTAPQIMAHVKAVEKSMKSYHLTLTGAANDAERD